MKSYSVAELVKALSDVGVRDGDIIYLPTRLFGLGPLLDANGRDDLVVRFYEGVRAAIGDSGTLVVPTYTQQVGRHGVPYVHELTECETGIFSEYVRKLPGARRSLHPVFSISAIGPQAAAITDDISPVAFGRESAFDRLYQYGAKTVCAGFPYYSGHVTALVHYVETMFAVPYYYNKYVLAEVWAGGGQITRPFVINVRYLDGECEFDFRRYIDTIAEAGELKSAACGSGMLYAVDIRRMVEIGLRLLREDIYAFLAAPPKFKEGKPPLDGPPERDRARQTVLGPE
jgi:aminoglycoside 3-N-acetyltransferase